MSSISINSVPVADMGEPAPAGDRSADAGKSKPTKSRKGRPVATVAPASGSAEQETVTDDGGKTAGSKSVTSSVSKTEIVLRKLRSVRGATVTQLCAATGWQAHSVRGFLSAVVRKKLGLPLSSEIGKDGVRRYRIADNV